MKPFRGSFIAITAAVLSFATLPVHAAFPERPIRLVIGMAPGGGTDTVARLIAEPLGQALKQPVVVENRPGAGAMIGAAHVAGAPADGYTILLATSAEMTIGPNMVENSRYDPVQDFLPIGMVASTPNVLLAHPSFEPKNLEELAKYVKDKPNEVFYGSGGVGTAPHMSGELLKNLGIAITHVPYKGTGPALADLVSGQTHLMMSTVGAALPFISNGQARPLAITSSTRSSLLPDTPTVAEQGLSGYATEVWYALFAPAGTPAPVQEKLSSALQETLNSPDVQERLKAMAIELHKGENSGEQMRERVKKETAQWREVITQNNIKPE